MDEQLRAAIDRARAAGMTGLACSHCAGDGARELQIHCEYGGRDETRTGPCPACDGSGYPSPAETVFAFLRASAKDEAEEWSPEAMAIECVDTYLAYHAGKGVAL